MSDLFDSSNQDNAEEVKSDRAAELNRRRQQKFREKEKAIRENAYETPLIEQAKLELRSNERLDLKSLLEDPKYRGALSMDDKEKLRIFVKNRARLAKQHHGPSIERERDEISNKEKAQRLENMLVSELHSALMRPLTESQRSDLILGMIEENLFTFLEFMETKLDTSNEFLQQIVELESRLDSQTFSKLLIRVFANYQCNHLAITKEMASQVLDALVGQTQDRDAALGLLRLMLLNDIPLNHMDVSQLLKFQEIYEIQVRSVFKSMQGPRMQVRESLPPSLFCFTPPLLQSLKGLGVNIHSQIPVQWLPHFISVIAFSFTEEDSQFHEFVRVFKEGVAELYDILKALDFPNLLQALCDITRQMHPRYFKQLISQTRVLTNAFEMVRKHAVVSFDDQVIQVLILDDKDALQTINSRPAVSIFQAQSQMHKIVSQLEKLNAGFQLDTEDLLRPLSQGESNAFRMQGIQNALPIQHVCFNHLMASKYNGRHFLSLETGQGKTALCLALAAIAAKDGRCVIITNSLEDLTFRDFKLANQYAQEMAVAVHLIDEGVPIQAPLNGIVFCTGMVLKDTLVNIADSSRADVVVIIDEFDQLLFDSGPNSEDVLRSLAKVNNIYGFTGSILQDHHKKFLARSLGANYMDFNVNLFNRLPPIQNEVKVFQTVREYREQICNSVAAKSTGCPVIIICGDQSEKISADLKRRSLAVMNLSCADLTTVESSLKIFNQKQGQNYPVYLINDRQGRGLDFKSSPDIEDAGGVFLILGILPQNILQYRQYIGRTGRIGNKGQYSVILYDKDSKGFVGSIYLQKQLEELKNKDLLKFNRLNQETRADAEVLKEATKYQEDEDSGMPMPTTAVLTLPDAFPKSIHLEEDKDGAEIDTISEAESSQVSCIAKDGTLIGVNSADAIKFSPSDVIPQTRDGFALCQKRPISEAEKLRRSEIDEGYFEAYGRLEIHHEMLNDKIRVSKYKEAIDKVCPGKIVIDVGAGTGVLSCMAAKAGAKSVQALEFSSIANQARKVIKENGHDSLVSVVQTKAEDFQVGADKVDVVVSEWMGYMLIYERMLQSVLKVRDSCLAPNGSMIPKQASISVAGIWRPNLTQGIMLNSIQLGNHKQAETADCSPEWICTSSSEILSLDLERDSFEENQFSSPFNLRMNYDSAVNGLVVWWDALLADDVLLSTSPFEEPTHWHQTILTFRKNLALKEGERIAGEIKVRPSKENYRGLTINLSITDNPIYSAPSDLIKEKCRDAMTLPSVQCVLVGPRLRIDLDCITCWSDKRQALFPTN